MRSYTAVTVQLERLLGRGKYSQVYLARELSTNQMVAIKRVSGGSSAPQHDRKWERVCGSWVTRGELGPSALLYGLHALRCACQRLRGEQTPTAGRQAAVLPLPRHLAAHVSCTGDWCYNPRPMVPAATWASRADVGPGGPLERRTRPGVYTAAPAHHASRSRRRRLPGRPALHCLASCGLYISTRRGPFVPTGPNAMHNLRSYAMGRSA